MNERPLRSPKPPATPLEGHAYARLSTTTEIDTYLTALAAFAPGVELIALGTSVGRRRLLGLRLASRAANAESAAVLRVLMVGSQHGATEAAGGEALLVLARELASGRLMALRDHIEFMLIPNANPDGRDLDSSRNADDVNINRDFVLLSQPEARSLNDALAQFAPHVVLDAHESAVFKRKTLAREGYLTDFETQFDCGNNPAVPAALRQFCEQVILPRLIERVQAAGIPAQRYMREIVSLNQVITQGGLTARKFRNKAALAGALSFLLETRLDPKDGDYPTYRNIGVRVDKQLQAQRSFLDVVAGERRAILALLTAHGQSLEPVVLSAEYASRDGRQTVQIRLREVASQALREFEFPDHRQLVEGASLVLPSCYWITAHAEAFARLLSAHGIAHTRLSASLRTRVVVQEYAEFEVNDAIVRCAERVVERELPAGSLQIAVRGPQARLLPLLLDARSPSSVFRYPAFKRLIRPAAEFFIMRAVAEVVA